MLIAAGSTPRFINSERMMVEPVLSASIIHHRPFSKGRVSKRGRTETPSRLEMLLGNFMGGSAALFAGSLNRRKIPLGVRSTILSRNHELPFTLHLFVTLLAPRQRSKDIRKILAPTIIRW